MLLPASPFLPFLLLSQNFCTCCTKPKRGQPVPRLENRLSRTQKTNPKVISSQRMDGFKRDETSRKTDDPREVLRSSLDVSLYFSAVTGGGSRMKQIRAALNNLCASRRCRGSSKTSLLSWCHRARELQVIQEVMFDTGNLLSPILGISLSCWGKQWCFFW